MAIIRSTQIPPRPSMPGGPSGEEQRRSQHQSARYDVADEATEIRLADWEGVYYSEQRRAVRGPGDISGNALVGICNQASTPGLYVVPPRVSHPTVDIDAFAGPGGVLERAHLWQQLQRVHFFVEAINTFAVHVGSAPGPDGTQSLCFRPTPPHNLYVRPHPSDPTLPIEIWELRLAEMTTRRGSDVIIEQVYTWHVWSVADPAEPFYAVFLAEQDGSLGRDITQDIVRAKTADGAVRTPSTRGPLLPNGEGYPYWYQNGAPCLPWVIYRRVYDGTTWSWTVGRSLFHGTLHGMMNWGSAQNAARDASGTTGIIFDATPVSAGTAPTDGNGGGGYQTRVLEPGSIEVWKSDPDKTGRLEPFGPGGNLDSISAYASRYEWLQYTRAGYAPDDPNKGNADPKSGAAIALSNEQKRAIKRQREPMFRASDLQLLAVVAVVARTMGLGTWPEGGYAITYAEIPKSPEELKAEREHLDWRRERGELSIVDIVMQQNPGLDRVAAIARIARARVDEAIVQKAVVDLGAAEGVTIPSPAVATLNGAQMVAVLDVAKSVHADEIEAPTGAAIVARGLGIPVDEAEGLAGTTRTADAGTVPHVDPPPAATSNA